MNELQFILYNTPEGNQAVQMVVRDETLWCTQKAMSLLFGVGVPAISKHLNHIFEEGELNADVVVSKMEIATQFYLLSELQCPGDDGKPEPDCDSFQNGNSRKIRKFQANEIYKR